MNALWQAEAKLNRALLAVIALTCRHIDTLAQQRLRFAGAPVLDPQDVDLAVPHPARHVGVFSVGGKQ